jgi:hypothetical protein
MSIASDVAVTIRFEQFGNLTPSSSCSEIPIAATYATAPVTQSEPPAIFFNGQDFNRQAIYLSKEGSQDFAISIWARLSVTNQTSASEFRNRAVIQLELQNSLIQIDDGH